MKWFKDDPDWIRMNPVRLVDGIEMLSRGEHPLDKINALMKEIGKGEFILLKTNFKPVPLIDEMTRQKYEVFSRSLPNEPDQHFTFIRRNV